MNKMIVFFRSYIKSMRLYYAFITGIAGWAGVAYYDYLTAGSSHPLLLHKKIIILVLMFLGWGLNQIFNDYLGLKEDRINAPNRPMVTGQLNSTAALLVSVILLIGASAVTLFYLEPVALIPMWAGIILNICYEYAKRYGILGNLVFGIMISSCTVFGFLAAGPVTGKLFTAERVIVWGFIALLNGIMTYFTYFKDYEGDKAAGVKTIIVKYGVDKSRKIGLFLSFLPTILFVLVSGLFHSCSSYHTTFLTLAALASFLQIWTGWLYYKHPIGERTYDSLATNFRACACATAATIGLFQPELASLLFLITYIFIGFLFSFYRDRKA